MAFHGAGERGRPRREELETQRRLERFRPAAFLAAFLVAFLPAFLGLRRLVGGGPVSLTTTSGSTVMVPIGKLGSVGSLVTLGVIVISYG